jgi:hypothetical protein
MNLKKVILIVSALAVIAAGVSYAAIPSADGTISACKSNKGALKMIDAEAGQSCPDGQQLLSWNQQGTAGPQGAPGTALGHAQVGYDGSVWGGSLTSANVYKDGPGKYCFGNLGFTPETAVVTLGWQSPDGGNPIPRVRLVDLEHCPIGFRQAAVTLRDPVTGATPDYMFYIHFN